MTESQREWERWVASRGWAELARRFRQLAESFRGVGRTAWTAAGEVRRWRKAWDRKICRDLGVRYPCKGRQLKKHLRRWERWVEEGRSWSH